MVAYPSDDPAGPGDIPASAAELTRRDLQQRALRGSVWSFALVAVALPLGLVANVVLARRLQPSEYGVLALLLVVYTVALQLSDLGFVVAQTQWGVEATTTGDEAQARRLLSQGLGFRLLVQFPVLSAVGLVLLRRDGLTAQVAWVLLALGGIPAGCLAISMVFENRSATIGRVSTISTFFQQAGIVAVAFVVDAAVPVLLVRMGLDLLGPVLLGFVVRPEHRRAALRPRLPIDMPPGFWRFASLAGVTLGLQLLVYSRSEVFVFRIHGEPVAAGIFALAFGLSQQLTLSIDALLAPLMPAVAGLVSAHAEHARRGTLRAMRYFALLAGGVVAVLPSVYFAVPVLFGGSFARAAPLVLPLGVVAAFQAATTPIAVLMYARRRGGTLVAANGSALAVDVAAAFALIPVLGLWGGVVANGLARLVSIGILTAVTARSEQLAVRDLSRSVRPWLLGVASLPVALGAGVMVRAVAGGGGGVAAALVAGVAAYASLLRWVGAGLEGGDVEPLLDVVPARLRGAASALVRLVTPVGGRHAAVPEEAQ